MQDLNDKVTSDSLTAIEWNQIPSELQNVIASLGITLSAVDLTQLGQAIAAYAAGGAFYVDSGAADAYVLSTVGIKYAPHAYFDGMTIIAYPGNANTGPSTVNVATLGVKSLKMRGGGDPAAGVVSPIQPLIAQYSASAGYFIIQNVKPLLVVSNATPQSVPTSTTTVKTFDAVVRDDFGAWNAGTNAWVVPAGVRRIRVTASNSWTSNVAGYRLLRVSGTTGVAGNPIHRQGASNEDEQNVHGEFDVTPGDSITVSLFQTSGGALNTSGTLTDEWLIIEVVN